MGCLVLLATGCSVGALDLDGASATRNECSEHRDCGSGKCVASQCYALEGTIESLLFEVTPPADATGIAGARFVEALTGLDPAGGELNLELRHVSRSSGVVLGPSTSSSCLAEPTAPGNVRSEDGSLPARISWIPRQRQLGLPIPSHVRETSLQEGSYRYSTAIPSGLYDIYVEPKEVVGECLQPPHLFANQFLEAGNYEALNLRLVAPRELNVVVRWPGVAGALEAWTLEVIEGETGRLLSTRGLLTRPVEKNGGGFEYTVKVAYVPVQVDPPGSARELFRLSPPAGVTAPRMIVDRSVVELFEEGHGIIDQLQSLPKPVQVVGQVSVENSTAAVAATVSLVATELRPVISVGTIVTFERVVETDESGQFSVDLLPGTYRVVAHPPVGSGLSPTEAVWQISPNQEVQAGRVVELGWSAEITGRVLAPGRGIVAGAAVQAVASVGAGSAGMLDNVLGRGSYTPRAEGVLTNADGRFTLIADRGLFDLWVRPGANSGFPWLVLPGVDASRSQTSLSELRMPLPVKYTGRVTSADLREEGVSGALVRAYAYVKGLTFTNDPSEATGVIQVAESRVAADGAFQLLLPEQLNTP